MTEVPEQGAPKTFIAARHQAKETLERLSQGVEPSELINLDVPEKMFSYIFKLQSEVEKSGNMDYKKYSGILWERLTGEQPIQDEEGFKQFQIDMINGLHNIDMSNFLNIDPKTMAELVEKYHTEIKSISIWSTGDVSATAYQLEKISNSQVISKFLRSVKSILPKENWAKFVEDKTAYMVADNKFERLTEYAKTWEKDASEPIKVVIIEDSVGNFQKAQQALDESLGKDKAQVIQIWFASSREGINAKAQAKTPEQKEELEKKMKDLHAINSFRELLDTDKYGAIFNNSHIFIDFDGVLGENIKMREEQAAVIYNSLLNGIVIHTGQDIKTVYQQISDNLEKI